MKAFLWIAVARALFGGALAEDYFEPEDFDPVQELALRKIYIREHSGIQKLRESDYTERGGSCAEAVSSIPITTTQSFAIVLGRYQLHHRYPFLPAYTPTKFSSPLRTPPHRM